MTTILTTNEIYVIYALTVAIFILSDYITIGKNGNFKKAMTYLRLTSGAIILGTIIIQVIQFYMNKG